MLSYLEKEVLLPSEVQLWLDLFSSPDCPLRHSLLNNIIIMFKKRDKNQNALKRTAEDRY